MPVISAIRVIVTTVASDPDSDNDGLTDSEEVALGTLPNNPDSDGDGLSDGKEVNELGTDPNRSSNPANGLHDLLYYGLDVAGAASEAEAMPELTENTGSLRYRIPSTPAADVDYRIELSIDLNTWYRIAHKLGGGSWEKDILQDATPVYPGIQGVTVLPDAGGVLIQEPVPSGSRMLRIGVTPVSP